jgi:Na+-transporting NADH:ubiquinone oxidoreductase subunit F
MVRRILQFQLAENYLGVLAAEKIFLSSACGGGGTCAQCEARVLEGGGEILATEKVTY